MERAVSAWSALKTCVAINPVLFHFFCSTFASKASGFWMWQICCRHSILCWPGNRSKWRIWDNTTIVARRVLHHIHGDDYGSKIENAQSAGQKQQANYNLMAILRGESITDEKQVEKLSNAPSQISMSVYRILDAIYPKPIGAIFRSIDWQLSFFCNLPRNDGDVVDGMTHSNVYSRIFE